MSDEDTAGSYDNSDTEKSSSLIDLYSLENQGEIDTESFEIIKKAVDLAVQFEGVRVPVVSQLYLLAGIDLKEVEIYQNINPGSIDDSKAEKLEQLLAAEDHPATIGDLTLKIVGVVNPEIKQTMHQN